MASIYNRPDSPFIWLRYKDPFGQWRNKKTGYLQNDTGQRKQAELVAIEYSFGENLYKTASVPKYENDTVVPFRQS
jgi:hypothetical protein